MAFLAHKQRLCHG